MSEIRATTISNAAGTGPITMTGQYAAKAWVNFNGTGTVAIRQSGNVSSITDNGAGNYTMNFTNATTDSNFSVSSCARSPGVLSGAAVQHDVYSTTSHQFYTRNYANSDVDFTIITVTITR